MASPANIDVITKLLQLEKSLQPALSERLAEQSYTNQVLGRPVWFRWDLRQWQCFSPDEPKAGTTTLGSPKRTLGAFCGGGLSGWGGVGRGPLLIYK
jgi:hypothetical protein